MIILNAEERIKKDIELFSKNLNEIKAIKLDEKDRPIINMAQSYRKDTDYYLEKDDYLTAFGCITYAHGLLDALRVRYNLI